MFPYSGSVRVTLGFAALAAVVIGLGLLIASGEQERGLGMNIETCGGSGTAVLVDYEDPSGLENPGHLPAFNASLDQDKAVYELDRDWNSGMDRADLVGEIACINADGDAVLNGLGLQIRALAYESRLNE